jgi:hypothetical protein
LLKQRISVPELIEQKPKNFLMLLTGLISIVSIFTLTLFSKETSYFSKSFGLVDNLFQTFYMISSFTFCYLSYDLLRKISLNELSGNNKLLIFKNLLLIFMFVQLVCYNLNLLLVSYYNPVIYSEKILISSMILILNINSICYYVMQTFFILTLTHDLHYVNLYLKIRPDLEYFIEHDDDFTDSKMIHV